MSRLCVCSEAGDRHVTFVPRQTVRDALIAGGVAVAGDCDGAGTCGRCRVEVEHPAPLTPAEHLQLTSADSAAHVRLACQVPAATGLRVTVTTPAEGWRELALPPVDRGGNTPPTPGGGGGRARGQSVKNAMNQDVTPSYGVAVDLGTTHVRVSLWDLRQRRRMGARLGPNPQAPFGADVLSRLAHAAASPRHADRLARLVVDAIGTAIRDLTAPTGLDPAAIGRVVIVGNTAMLTLLTAHEADALLDPERWTTTVACDVTDAGAWREAWRIGDAADILVVPPLAGFVGSDLVAAVIATDLCACRRSLLIDFGTNTEVAYWDGETLHVTSAAGGPAFEGSGVGCGMPAERGAIVHVTRSDAPAHDLRCDVLGGGEARGISGSGLVDAIACLLDAGDLTPAGRFTTGGRDHRLVISGGVREIALAKRDIDVFQRAKGAIAAATRILLDSTGNGAAPPDRLCVCGAFGEHLAPLRAQAIGLLPSVPPNQVEMHGHAALTGAEDLLASDRPEHAWTQVTARSRVLNLAFAPDYEAQFIAHLTLRPTTIRETARC